MFEGFLLKFYGKEEILIMRDNYIKNNGNVMILHINKYMEGGNKHNSYRKKIFSKKNKNKNKRKKTQKRLQKGGAWYEMFSWKLIAQYLILVCSILWLCSNFIFNKITKLKSQLNQEFIYVKGPTNINVIYLNISERISPKKFILFGEKHLDLVGFKGEGINIMDYFKTVLSNIDVCIDYFLEIPYILNTNDLIVRKKKIYEKDRNKREEEIRKEEEREKEEERKNEVIEKEKKFKRNY